MTKIRTLEALAAERFAPPALVGGASTWVLCHGVFDLLHIGHIVHLQWARAHGVLVVSVTPNRVVDKGQGRPYFSQSQRCLVLEALACTNFVVPSISVDALPILEKLKPEIYVKGPDVAREPTTSLVAEKAYVESYGGLLLYSPPDCEFHSTDILEFKKRCGSTSNDQNSPGTPTESTPTSTGNE